MVRNVEICFKLASNDGHEFTLSKDAIRFSGLIVNYAKHYDLLKDDEAIKEMDPMPLLNVDGEALHLIQKWLEKHKECELWEEEMWWKNDRNDELTKWEDNFVNELSMETLFKLYLAANYMDIRCLTDKCSLTVANLVKGKSIEEMREIWMLSSDFSKEELDSIRSENPWEVILAHQAKLEREKAERLEQAA